MTEPVEMLTRSGHLVPEHGVTYLAQTDADHPLASLQAASCTYRIARLRSARRPEGAELAYRGPPGREKCCATVRRRTGVQLARRSALASDQRKKLERLCRYITRPARANERLSRNAKGQIVLQLKSPYRDGTTHIVMQPQEFMQRLAALVPRPRLHLIRFHGVLAPHARLRAAIVPGALRRRANPRTAKQRA